MLATAGQWEPRLTSPLSEVAELATLEPLQCQREGIGTDPHTPPERVVEGTDGKQRQGDHRGQRPHHKRVDQGVVQTEEVGRLYPILSAVAAGQPSCPAPAGVCSLPAYRNNNADATNSETKNPFRIKIPRTPGGLPEPNPKISAITATNA